MTGAHPLVVTQRNIFCVKVLEKLREVIRQLCQHVVVRLECPDEEICIVFELFFRVDWLVSKVWWRRTGCAVCRISEILNWNCFWKFQIQGLQTSDHRFSPVQFQLEELHVNWTEPERIMNQMHNCFQCTSHPKSLLIWYDKFYKIKIWIYGAKKLYNVTNVV